MDELNLVRKRIGRPRKNSTVVLGTSSVYKIQQQQEEQKMHEQQTQQEQDQWPQQQTHQQQEQEQHILTMPSRSSIISISNDNTIDDEIEFIENENGNAIYDPAALTECRRSARKKVQKFDVLEVLNKTRKTHKIKIEARIDSDEPSSIMPETIASNDDYFSRGFSRRNSMFESNGRFKNIVPKANVPQTSVAAFRQQSKTDMDLLSLRSLPIIDLTTIKLSQKPIFVRPKNSLIVAQVASTPSTQKPIQDEQVPPPVRASSFIEKSISSCIMPVTLTSSSFSATTDMTLPKKRGRPRKMTITENIKNDTLNDNPENICSTSSNVNYVQLDTAAKSQEIINTTESDGYDFNLLNSENNSTLKNFQQLRVAVKRLSIPFNSGTTSSENSPKPTTSVDINETEKNLTETDDTPEWTYIDPIEVLDSPEIVTPIEELSDKEPVSNNSATVNAEDSVDSIIMEIFDEDDDNDLISVDDSYKQNLMAEQDTELESCPKPYIHDGEMEVMEYKTNNLERISLETNTMRQILTIVRSSNNQNNATAPDQCETDLRTFAITKEYQEELKNEELKNLKLEYSSMSPAESNDAEKLIEEQHVEDELIETQEHIFDEDSSIIVFEEENKSSRSPFTVNEVTSKSVSDDSNRSISYLEVNDSQKYAESIDSEKSRSVHTIECSEKQFLNLLRHDNANSSIENRQDSVTSSLEQEISTSLIDQEHEQEQALEQDLEQYRKQDIEQNQEQKREEIIYSDVIEDNPNTNPDLLISEQAAITLTLAENGQDEVQEEEPSDSIITEAESCDLLFAGQETSSYANSTEVHQEQDQSVSPFISIDTNVSFESSSESKHTMESSIVTNDCSSSSTTGSGSRSTSTNATTPIPKKKRGRPRKYTETVDSPSECISQHYKKLQQQSKQEKGNSIVETSAHMNSDQSATIIATSTTVQEKPLVIGVDNDTSTGNKPKLDLQSDSTTEDQSKHIIEKVETSVPKENQAGVVSSSNALADVARQRNEGLKTKARKSNEAIAVPKKIYCDDIYPKERPSSVPIANSALKNNNNKSNQHKTTEQPPKIAQQARMSRSKSFCHDGRIADTTQKSRSTSQTKHFKYNNIKKKLMFLNHITAEMTEAKRRLQNDMGMIDAQPIASSSPEIQEAKSSKDAKKKVRQRCSQRSMSLCPGNIIEFPSTSSSAESSKPKSNQKNNKNTKQTKLSALLVCDDDSDHQSKNIKGNVRSESPQQGQTPSTSTSNTSTPKNQDKIHKRRKTMASRSAEMSLREQVLKKSSPLSQSCENLQTKLGSRRRNSTANIKNIQDMDAMQDPKIIFDNTQYTLPERPSSVLAESSNSSKSESISSTSSASILTSTSTDTSTTTSKSIATSSGLKKSNSRVRKNKKLEPSDDSQSSDSKDGLLMHQQQAAAAGRGAKQAQVKMATDTEVHAQSQAIEEDSDPLKDIEQFIAAGVNLLKDSYKIDNSAKDDKESDANVNASENATDNVTVGASASAVASTAVVTTADDDDEDDASDEDLNDDENDDELSRTLAKLSEVYEARIAQLETPADTPEPPSTPTTPLSTSPLPPDDMQAGVRRSHRIKQKPQAPKACVARGVVRDKERTTTTDDGEECTVAYTMQEQLIELAEIEQINEKFLKAEKLNTFQMIRENYFKCNRVISKETRDMQCECYLTPEEEANGQLGCGEGCINRMIMIECGEQCVNKQRCTNKRFQKQLCTPCRVFRTEKKGCGIVAEIGMHAGEFIMEYVGEVIDQEEFERRQHRYSRDKNRHYYFMALGNDAIIDATSKGNISRYINHSCDPNAETQKWTVNGEVRIGFFSRKTILPGEEITFDYQYQRYGRDAQPCFCEASTCRGWIGKKPSPEDIDIECSSSDADEDSNSLTGDIDDIDSDEDSQESNKKFGIVKDKKPGDKLLKEKKIVKGKQPHKRRKYVGDAKVHQPRKRAWANERAVRKAKAEKQMRLLEDPDIEEEVALLSRSGLKNQSFTLRLSRVMVRAKLLQTRLNLLDVLRNGDLPCRRLFLDYHGLRLLHGWMNENSSDFEFRQVLVSTFEELPIPNKTMLNDSKIYPTIKSWLNSGDAMAASANEYATSRLTLDSIDFNERVKRLLAKWDNLPEIFRIPKRTERIEQMKEHEREADRVYAPVALEPNLNKTTLDVDRYKRDRFGRDINSRYSKIGTIANNNNNGNGNNTINNNNNSNGSNGTNNGSVPSSPGAVIASVSSSKENRSVNIANVPIVGPTGSYRMDARRRSDNVQIISNNKHLPKELRRELFERKVARDVAEKRHAEERRIFEAKCQFFGIDAQNYDAKFLPAYRHDDTGEWFNEEGMPVPPPPLCGSAAPPPPSLQTNNPGYYKLPSTMQNLPPTWTFGINPQGFIFYYSIANRIPQWEPPTLEQINNDNAIVSIANRDDLCSETDTNSEDDEDNDDEADAFIISALLDIEKPLVDIDSDFIDHLTAIQLKEYVRDKIKQRRMTRYKRLESVRTISPRREEDRLYNQMESRKYKENKEKIRRRKEIYRRRRLEISGEALALKIAAALPPATTVPMTAMLPIATSVQTVAATTTMIPTKAVTEVTKITTTVDNKHQYQTLPIHDYLYSSDEEIDIDACNASPLIDALVQDDKLFIDELDALNNRRHLKRTLALPMPPLCYEPSTSKGAASGSSLYVPPSKKMPMPTLSADLGKLLGTGIGGLNKFKRHPPLSLPLPPLSFEASTSSKTGEDRSDSKKRRIDREKRSSGNHISSIIKDRFRLEISGIIVECLKPYRKETCQRARIINDTDFNQLARRLTHYIIAKEVKYCESIGQTTLIVTDSVKHKTREYIKMYMQKYGKVYKRPDAE